MNHPAELAIHSFLQKVMLGETSMDKATIDLVAKDVQEAMAHSGLQRLSLRIVSMSNYRLNVRRLREHMT